MKKSKPRLTSGHRARSKAKLISSKSDQSRENIIAAALKVFARHPYHLATIRMVARAGGFDHQLINYYFPAKADLFEAVVVTACEDFSRAHESWFEGLNRTGIRESFSLFLDRHLDYHEKHPEPLRILALNAPLLERLEEIPGYQHVPTTLAKLRADFERNTNLRADSDQIGRFVTAFNLAIINFLGAAPSQAEILGMDPNSAEYRTWVKETLLYVFFPLLKNLIFPE
jgi:AcrR family transcriptional regulator